MLEVRTPSPRQSQISLVATLYYHCVSPQAFLCGQDYFTSRTFDHSRALIESELLRVCEVFFLEGVAFAVISSHWHMVLFVDLASRREATAPDIVSRSHQIHHLGNAVYNKLLNHEPPKPHEKEQLDVFID